MDHGLEWKKWITVMKLQNNTARDFQKKKFESTTVMALGQRSENKEGHMITGIIAAFLFGVAEALDWI